MSLYSKITKAMKSPFLREEAKADPTDALRDAATEFARHRGSQACSEFLAKLLVAMVFESKTNFSRFVTGLPAASWQYADGEKWKIEGRGEVQVEVSGKWVRVNSPKAKDDSWLL